MCIVSKTNNIDADTVHVKHELYFEGSKVTNGNKQVLFKSIYIVQIGTYLNVILVFQITNVLKKILIFMEMMSNLYLLLMQVHVRWNARLMKNVSFGVIKHYLMTKI